MLKLVWLAVNVGCGIKLEVMDCYWISMWKYEMDQYLCSPIFI